MPEFLDSFELNCFEVPALATPVVFEEDPVNHTGNSIVVFVTETDSWIFSIAVNIKNVSYGLRLDERDYLIDENHCDFCQKRLPGDSESAMVYNGVPSNKFNVESVVDNLQSPSTQYIRSVKPVFICPEEAEKFILEVENWISSNSEHLIVYEL